MSVKNCIIIDDEPHARSLLRELVLQSSRNLSIIAEASNVDQAIQLIASHTPDIIFLDVRIQDRLGFEILDHFENRTFDVIFTTAFDHYAVDAFRYEAIHYLLKPYSLSALEDALDRCFNGSSNGQQKDDTVSILSIPNRTETLRIKSMDVLYLIGAGAYTEIYIKGGKSILASKALGYFENHLDDRFMRAHKKHIVNTAEIERYEKGAKPTIIMSDGRSLEVSRTYKSALLETL